MCGIFLILSRLISNLPPHKLHKAITLETENELARRGPDFQGKLEKDDIKLLSSVLHLRGKSLVEQPQSKDHIWFAWNGEVFGANIYGSTDYDLNANDTIQILDKLLTNNPLQVFSQIEGPFAFIVIDWIEEAIWFGRDFLGRRSLMIYQENNVLQIGSIGLGEEVPTGGIFKISLRESRCEHIAWLYPGLNSPSSLRFSNEENFDEKISNETFESILSKSVQKRVIGYGDIGILFSGGIDSTIIAALANRFLPENSPIYLLNVAFTSEAPDRETALQSYHELQSACPSRNFLLICINASQSDIDAARDHIIQLLATNDTRMDFSIGTALYFASKGEGILESTGEFINFPGKILLSGSGADEILGGYSRYRSNFLQYLEEGVIREMSLDLDRIWHRNLGRDDRVTATHGRELRFPFLDTYLWRFLSKLPLKEVCRFDVPHMDKWILRELAKNIGIPNAGVLKKRAIQFGTRIAQLCNIAECGSNRKAKGWIGIENDRQSQLESEVEWASLRLILKYLENSTEDLERSIKKLLSPDIKSKEKRHIMRVYLGDYIQIMKEISIESTVFQIRNYDIANLPNFGVNLEKYN
ncbi:unnamed protein product [Blepharisma stoltei]|uniref:Glutamine amidotransferase type-2 domain-containing protein n=1 Tax=Blepharisma stoltei TaxID=1481888 RepID=A0AAU9IEF3_9CILI|nr:unnamed protein product [Blepharisma stoltei]